MPKSVISGAYAPVVEYLVRLRKAKGVSQVELAVRLGKGQQFVSRFERYGRRLDLVEFYAVVTALGADPAQAAADVFRALPADISI